MHDDNLWKFSDATYEREDIIHCILEFGKELVIMVMVNNKQNSGL